MTKLIAKKQIDKATWNHYAHVNAEHRAKIFIDAGNTEKAAKALKEVPYNHAIAYLYHLGKMYLYHHDHRAETVAEVSKLIKKNLKQKPQPRDEEIVLPHAKHTPLVKRHTLKEIFA